MAADGSIVIDVDIDNKKAQQELDRLNRRIQNLNDQLYTKRQQQMPLIEQSKQLAAELDTAKRTLDSMKTGGEFFTSSSIAEQESRVNQLQKEWDAVQRKVENYDNQIEKSNISLNLAQERAGALQQQLAAAGPTSERMSQAMERMQKSASRFSLRLREVVRSALVFTLISQALASLREWLGRVIQSNNETAAAIGRLQGALLTLAQPLLNVIIPAFTAFVNILAQIVTAIANVVSLLFGSTVQQSSQAAESLNNEANALEGVGSAAEEVPFVGSFVELFGDREEHLDASFRIGFCEPDVSEREDEAALSGLEKSAHCTQRAQSFIAGERVRSHFRRVLRQGPALRGWVSGSFTFWFPGPGRGEPGFFWRVYAAGCG